MINTLGEFHVLSALLCIKHARDEPLGFVLFSEGWDRKSLVNSSLQKFKWNKINIYSVLAL